MSERCGAAQTTVSGMERCRFLRLAAVPGRSPVCFLPGVESSDLSDHEQTLIALFRELHEQSQLSLPTTGRNRVGLYKETKAIEALPEDQREDVAYDLVAQLLELQALKVAIDAEGRPYLDDSELKALLETKDEKDRQIPEQLTRRLEEDHRWRMPRRGGVMDRCVFCLSTDGPFTTREHVLPESLSGTDWGVLPQGIVCDPCNHYFGVRVEEPALSDYPLSFFRGFLGVPTKHRKIAVVRLSLPRGILRAARIPGQYGVEDPSSEFMQLLKKRGRITALALAEPLKPQATCRLLLKMAIEMMAVEHPEQAYSGKLSPAREFARYGRKKGDWWFLSREDAELALHYINEGVTWSEWQQNMSLRIAEIGSDTEVYKMLAARLLYLDLIVPLDPTVQPGEDLDAPPRSRVFRV